MYISLFDTWQAELSAKFERLEAIHSESRSHQTNCMCFGRSIQAIATENVPAQQSTTRPIGRVSLQMMFYIQKNSFNPIAVVPQNRMDMTQYGTLVHLVVHVERLTFDSSIRDASILCC